MTNNHCPTAPARAHRTRATEVKVAEFAESIMSQITEFAETVSMDEMIILDPRILESWTECKRCESLICEVQGKEYSYIIQTVMNYLKSEF